MSYYDLAYSTTNTIENTKHYTQHILDNKVPGILIECGVAKGSQLGAMQDVLTSNNETRWIYGFDSFRGIPLASVNDTVQPGIGPNPYKSYTNVSELLVSSGVTVCSKDSVRKNLNFWTNNKSDNIILVEGWFQNTLIYYKEVVQKLGGISLLRLDGDLYESTKICLETLFPLLNNGGILIIDDWQLHGCKKAFQEYFVFNNVCRIKPPFGDETDGPAYFIKQDVPFLKYRKNVYSQNGEDGILSELLNRLQIEKGWVCEFGAWDGIQCSNTFSLVEKGFDAVYIEARDDYYQKLLQTCRQYKNITPIHCMVQYEGEDILDNILAITPIPEDFDILSIDIDSSDYQVWRSVEKYNPKIVVIEVNSSISPIVEDHIHGGEYETTSFLPMLRLGQEKGYTLICHTGNLIFIRNDLKHVVEDELIQPELCHRTNWLY
jgi:hypothetical protein